MFKFEDLQPGDVVYFRSSDYYGQAWALYMGNANYFELHTSEDGVVIGDRIGDLSIDDIISVHRPTENSECPYGDILFGHGEKYCIAERWCCNCDARVEPTHKDDYSFWCGVCSQYLYPCSTELREC